MNVSYGYGFYFSSDMLHKMAGAPTDISLSFVTPESCTQIKKENFPL